VRRIGVSLLLGALLLVAGVAVGTPASACSCAGIPSAAAAFASADAVFTGRLVSREVRHPDWPMVSSGDPAVHVFAVDEVFKGAVHEEQGVLSADSGASCGLELTGPGPFVVFATGSDGGYSAGLCGGTTPATAEIETELRALADTPPEPLAGAGGTDPSGPSGPVIAVAGALVLALAGWLLLRRRRSRTTT
jgi:LPXTG-motif cell wall-anchored protein